MGLVTQSYAHPVLIKNTAHSWKQGLSVSGGGDVKLFVRSLSGIYVFCASVISSILLFVVGCVQSTCLGTSIGEALQQAIAVKHDKLELSPAANIANNNVCDA